MVWAVDTTLQPFNQWERLEGDEGNLNSLSEKIFLRFLRYLVQEHNAGGRHLDLDHHDCIGYQHSNRVNFCTYTTPMLLLHQCSSVNAGWQLQAGFNASFCLSNKQIDLMGVTTHSLGAAKIPFVLLL
jgi:hypothetical protein